MRILTASALGLAIALPLAVASAPARADNDYYQRPAQSEVQPWNGGDHQWRHDSDRNLMGDRDNYDRNQANADRRGYDRDRQWDNRQAEGNRYQRGDEDMRASRNFDRRDWNGNERAEGSQQWQADRYNNQDRD